VGNNPTRERLRSELTPLDYEVLSRLPDEGTKQGLAYLGRTVKNLAESLHDLGVTSAMLNGRVRAMRDLGLIVPVKVLPVKDGLGWQITQVGKDELARQQEEE
jgi:hypothetical protein